MLNEFKKHTPGLWTVDTMYEVRADAKMNDGSVKKITYRSYGTI